MSTVVMKRVVRACDYVPAHLRRGPMKYTEIEVTEKETKSMMRFSEVIAALEDGKKVRCEDAKWPYFWLVSPAPGLRQQLVEVFEDGSWSVTTLRFTGRMQDDKWSVIEKWSVVE